MRARCASLLTSLPSRACTRLPLALLLLTCLVASAAPALKLCAAPPLAAGQDIEQDSGQPFTPEQLDALVPPLMQSLHVPGVSVVVIERRAIAWQRHYGVRTAGTTDTVDTNTVFEACSMSKLPATYLALQLVERGQLELHKPLVQYLDKPYLPDQPLHEQITAHMALVHTTGFPNWREGGWQSGNPLPVQFTPGSQFGYSGEGFLYLQRVMEHMTETPFEPLVQRELLVLIKMTSSSYVWQDRFNAVAAAGHDDQGLVKQNRRHFTRANAGYSLYCTAQDYARFLIEILRMDRSAKHSLSAAMIARMETRQLEATGRQPMKRAGPLSDQVTYRGLGWAIDATQHGDRIYHSGSNGTGFRCYCEFDPARGTGLVIMTNSYSGRQLWEKVVAELVLP